jgi:hypothetical protein
MIRITEKSVHVRGHALVMFLIGRGFEPLAGYTCAGDQNPTFVFTGRAQDAVEAFYDLRKQLSAVPTIPVPERSTRNR